MKTVKLTKKEIEVIIDALCCPTICASGCSIDVGSKTNCDTCWVNKTRYDLIEKLQ